MLQRFGSLREPAVGVEQLDADSLLAIIFVDPDTIDFGLEFSPEWWREHNTIAGRRLCIDQDCRFAAADFDDSRFDFKRFAIDSGPFDHQREVYRVTRAARALPSSGALSVLSSVIDCLYEVCGHR